MDFGRHRPRPRGESIVPMINVIFLLLVFFLMTATLVPPEPFDTVLPETGMRAPAETDDAAYVAADGTLDFGGARGDAALDALRGRTAPLDIRADARLAATDLARVLARLSEIGITDLRLRALER